MNDLYRMFDRAGRLLYVGISFNAGERATQHAETKPWWPQVDHIRIEHLECSREDALRKERWTIYTEKPFYNVQHNHGRHELSARAAVVKPYDVPHTIWRTDEWQNLKKAVHAFVTALTDEHDRKTYNDPGKGRCVKDGATVLDLDIDAIGLIEAMALSCRYTAPCEGCGDEIVPDYARLEHGYTYVSTSDLRCVSQPLETVDLFGYCPTCDTLTKRHTITLKDGAAA